jgi:predicted alpha/beta hydrolase family esterase
MSAAVDLTLQPLQISLPGPVVFIHGASSTPRSFAYLKHRLEVVGAVDVAYDDAKPAEEVVDELVQALEPSPAPATLIGHSLGGVIAVAAAQRSSKVDRVVTLASPLGGCPEATFLRFVSPRRVLEDVHPLAPLMVDVRRAAIAVPVLSIVTTEDTVVGVASQRALEGPTYVPFPLNHFEVLLDDQVAECVSGFILAGAARRRRRALP